MEVSFYVQLYYVLCNRFGNRPAFVIYTCLPASGIPVWSVPLFQ